MSQEGQAVSAKTRLCNDLQEKQDAVWESERRHHDGHLEPARANHVMAMAHLSASIAHEVSQPLSGLVTNAATCMRMLAADSPNINGAQETVRRIVRDANRVSDIIARLRALFSQRERPSELLDLNDALREVVSLSLEQLQSRRVTLRAEFADGLPPIRGDRVQLQQVLLNLIRNGSDAMNDVDDRPRQLTIRTSATEAGGVLVAVQDSGSGVHPADLDRVFDAFYTTKPDGLGMGLSICRTIIDAHGGKLWATAAVPYGAIFQFTLPGQMADGELGHSPEDSRVPTRRRPSRSTSSGAPSRQAA